MIGSKHIKSKSKKMRLKKKKQRSKTFKPDGCEGVDHGLHMLGAADEKVRSLISLF